MSKSPDGIRADAVVLVAGADQNFAIHMLVSLHSALRNLDRSRPVWVYMINGGICQVDIDRIKSRLRRAHPLVNVNIVSPDSARIASLHTTERYPSATYLRLLIPSVLPPSVDRVLYLDSDIVVTDDLCSLFDVELGETLICAVQETLDESRRLRKTLSAEELPEDMPYFNAGVLIMNLREWRRLDVSDRALVFLERFGQLLFRGDQDALNLAVAGNWRRVPERWNNVINGHRLRFPQLQSYGAPKGILHFVGDKKPWRAGNACRMKHVYLHALAKSGWFGPVRRMMLWLEVCYWSAHHRLRFTRDLLKERLVAASKQ